MKGEWIKAHPYPPCLSHICQVHLVGRTTRPWMEIRRNTYGIHIGNYQLGVCFIQDNTCSYWEIAVFPLPQLPVSFSTSTNLSSPVTWWRKHLTQAVLSGLSLRIISKNVWSLIIQIDIVNPWPIRIQDPSTKRLWFVSTTFVQWKGSTCNSNSGLCK